MIRSCPERAYFPENRRCASGTVTVFAWLTSDEWRKLKLSASEADATNPAGTDFFNVPPSKFSTPRRTLGVPGRVFDDEVEAVGRACRDETSSSMKRPGGPWNACPRAELDDFLIKLFKASGFTQMG